MANSGIKTNDFPILADSTIVYLDSAATALKPQSVIDKITEYYRDYPANVFRGLYPLSARATEEYEKARETIAQLIHAASHEEVVFVRSTTEAINLVAYAWGRMNIGEGDEIVTTVMEHHSNFLPWQELCRESGATLKVLDIDDSYELLVTSYESSEKIKSAYDYSVDLSGVITKKTKLVALTHVSNVLGTINPVKDIVAGVKKINPHCLVLIDGAQAVPHMTVDVMDIGADFYAFSGHKMMGPTGIGVLWARKELLERMPPFQFGGSMIESVTLDEAVFAPPPAKFEAGTPHIAGAIGLGEAASYLTHRGMDAVRAHEKELTEYALEKLTQVDRLHIYGPLSVKKRAGVVSFNIYTNDGKLIHPHDAGDVLGRMGVCVRVGHHCAMPLARRLKIPASIRASLYVYNTKKDVDRLIEGLKKVVELFK